MKMQRVMIQLPADLKAQLQAMRGQGTTISGYVRSLIERALHDSHEQSALEHGADDDGELGEQRALLLGGKRDRLLDPRVELSRHGDLESGSLDAHDRRPPAPR